MLRRSAPSEPRPLPARAASSCRSCSTAARLSPPLVALANFRPVGGLHLPEAFSNLIKLTRRL